MANSARLRCLRSNNRRRCGLAALEFALTLPIWVTLLLGLTDGAYCMLVNERVDRVAYTVTDVVTQYQTITIANLNDIVQAAGELMQPLNFAGSGLVIVTSIYKPAGQVPKIMWQYKGGGAGTEPSQIGNVGGTPTLPTGLTLNDNDNIIISEVYFNFTPMFTTDTIFTSNTIYRYAIYKPRLSPLITTPT